MGFGRGVLLFPRVDIIRLISADDDNGWDKCFNKLLLIFVSVDDDVGFLLDCSVDELDFRLPTSEDLDFKCFRFCSRDELSFEAILILSLEEDVKGFFFSIEEYFVGRFPSLDTFSPELTLPLSLDEDIDAVLLFLFPTDFTVIISF